MKKNLLLIAFLSITILSRSQQLWTEESAGSQRDYLNRNRSILPDKFKFFRIDASVLQQEIAAARSFGTGATTATLQLPLPDGTLITADVYESSILSPELQAIIPGVKTYMLVDKISKSSLGRITITANAITGLIFTKQGSVYINPVNESANKTHIVYYTKEINVPENVLCGVIDEPGRTGNDQFGAKVTAGDCQLRTYRLAVAATGEYYVWAGSSQVNALAYITICINVVNAIYERDATIRFNLVTNNNIIYTDATTDPYTSGALTGTVLTENDNATDLNLGTTYDVGIVFNNGWSGGLAQLSSVCTVSKGRAGAGITFGTGANPTAGPQGPVFDATVAHEIGHQFSATHTMIANNAGCAGNVTAASAWEPGGGSTIMAYAGTCTGNSYQSRSDLYFHTGNVAQIANYATSGTGNTCPITTSISNVAPSVTVAAASYTIPVSTPFVLSATATDANGNDLTYTWEQMDAAAETSSPPSATSTTGPNFRSYPQSASPTRYFPNLTAVLAGTTPTYEVLPSVTRTMNFRFNVRDNAAGGGCNDQEDISVSTSAGAGPFTVTSQSTPTSLTADGSTTFTVTWNVANTNLAPVSCANVDILFSADGGANFNYTLLSGTANDGTENIIIPNIPTSSGRIMIKAAGNIFFNVNAAAITISSGCGAEGATITPSVTVTASPGHSSLNLSSAPTFGSVIVPISGTLESSDPATTLAVSSTVVPPCRNFGNEYRYDVYTFQVNVAGTYTFRRSTGSIIVNLYSGSFNPGSPCTNLLASNGSNTTGTSTSIGLDATASLIPGVLYTLTVGTFAAGSPALPFAYTISLFSAPPGGDVYSGYPNPGGLFSYGYVIVNNATNNIVAISTTPDLRNTSTFPLGTYTVYGFSYLTTDFSAGVLNGYVGGPFSTFSNDLLNNPGSRCGNLSKNTVTVNITTVLPVRILPLTAASDNQEVKLYWATASETGSKHFEIERSGDGQTFTLLKTLPAALNSDSRINYTSDDPSPLPDKNFYRVKAVDLDGKYVYSNIAIVKKLNTGIDVKAYPNPVRDKYTLEILAARSGTGILEITNATGGTIRREQLNWKKGVNVEIVDMQNLPAGVYYIKITSDNDMVTQKAIKI